MIRKYIALGALTGLAACSGGEFLFPIEDEEVVETSEIPESLANNLRSISFNPTAGNITVEMTGLDTTPLRAVYTRRPSMDVAGYTAYAVQEDALDRLFVALVAESGDGSVQAGVVADGGQFNRVFSGGYYQKSGAFTRPTLGTGPGAGQVSYAGTYGALVNGGGDGSELLPVPDPGGVDPVLLPGQPAQITGSVFINANFADNTVSGAIYNRILVDQGFTLDSIILLPTDIAVDGTFFGDVEPSGRDESGGTGGSNTGEFGGTFGGNSASSVGGIVVLSDFDTRLLNEEELGVFVLTQCGLPGDAAICDNVAPF